MLSLTIIYWLGLIAEIVIRAPYQKSWRASQKIDQRDSRTDQIMLALLSVGMLVFPLIYTFTSWLDFANYALPPGLGLFGVFLLALAVLLFALAHRGLHSYWQKEKGEGLE